MQSLPQNLPPDLIVFDGECMLCSGFYRFMLKHDRHQRFAFATAQSPIGQQLYQALGLLTLRMKLAASAKGLHYAILKASIFGIKAPRFLRPNSDTWETAGPANDFHFSVTATAFLAGRLIHDQGPLKPL